MSTSTGTGERSASDRTAAPRPGLAQDRRVEALGELAQLGDRRADLLGGGVELRGDASGGTSGPSRERIVRSDTASATRRCCAPSCRSRSTRRRSASAASTIRVRDARTSSSWARRSSWSRALSTASADHGADRPDHAPGRRAGSRRGRRRRSTRPPASRIVAARPLAGRGQRRRHARVVDPAAVAGRVRGPARDRVAERAPQGPLQLLAPRRAVARRVASPRRPSEPARRRLIPHAGARAARAARGATRGAGRRRRRAGSRPRSAARTRRATA